MIVNSGLITVVLLGLVCIIQAVYIVFVAKAIAVTARLNGALTLENKVLLKAVEMAKSDVRSANRQAEADRKSAIRPSPHLEELLRGQREAKRQREFEFNVTSESSTGGEKSE